jgi:hypothetical protein
MKKNNEKDGDEWEKGENKDANEEGVHVDDDDGAEEEEWNSVVDFGDEH